MRYYIEKLYVYSFEDLLLNVFGYSYATYYDDDLLAGMLIAYDITYTIGTGSLIKSIWSKICNEYSKMYVYMGGSEEPTNEDIRGFLTEFLNIYENTKDYYEPLISYYNISKEHLMDDIKNINEVMFNDTPQTANGVLDGDAYATHYTKSTSKSPLATPMARLQEIQDGLKRLYQDWVKEFRKLFIEKNFVVYE